MLKEIYDYLRQLLNEGEKVENIEFQPETPVMCIQLTLPFEFAGGGKLPLTSGNKPLISRKR